MKNVIWWLPALFLCFSRCAETPQNSVANLAPPPAPIGKTETIRGLLTIPGNNIATVLDQVNNEIYQIDDKTGQLQTAYSTAAAPCHYTSEYVFAVLTGRFNGTGIMGFRKFEATQLDTVSAKTPENLASLGVPFEFWCHGTEPFWSIQVSNYEGGIFYENASDGSAWFCPWMAPEANEAKTQWVYKVAGVEGQYDAFTFRIKKEKCDDGMSEQVYDYSVLLTIKGNQYKGVAIKGTGKVFGFSGNKHKY